MVLTGPAMDIFWCSILFGSWSLLGLPGPATDAILDFQFAILPVYAGPAAAMDEMSCSFSSSRVLNELDSVVVLAAPACFGWSLLCCAIFLRK